MESRGGAGAGEDSLRRRRHRRRRQVDADVVACPSTSLESRSCPQGWADLPDGLLHSIIPLLVSFPDILAFSATCPSWRAAFSCYLSKSSFSTRLPPLLIQPDVPFCSPRPRPDSSSLMMPLRPCCVTNLASQNMYMCCQIPLFCQFGNRSVLAGPMGDFRFIAASYGHLILSSKQSRLFVVVDVFTGASVASPQLPVGKINLLDYATLTAPLASPNSHLMVTIRAHNFFWRVGSHSWESARSTYKGMIKQVVVLKGQVIGTGNGSKLFIVHFVPGIRIQEIAVDQGDDMMVGRRDSLMCLVACGDMLLMVRCPRSFALTGDRFEAFRLDLSAEPAKWVKVEKLENWAIFISTDERSQTLCCMDPERWGGRSNCIYCYHSEEWIACELDKPLQRDITFRHGPMMQPMWVVPSMFYPCP